MRVVRVASRDHALSAATLVDGDDLDAVQVVGRQAKLSTEEAERASDDVAANTDPRVFAERDYRAPGVEQRLERVADGHAGLKRDRAHIGVEVDPLHRR